MKFLIIAAWDRVSKQKFSKDKNDLYYLLKMYLSESSNDGKIDIFTLKGEKCAVLPKDNYSGQNETPGRKTVV